MGEHPNEDQELWDRMWDEIVDLRERARALTRPPQAPGRTGSGTPGWWDWDANAYLARDELDREEWRWEFLRRNQGYRQDWLRSEEEFSTCTRERYFEEVYRVSPSADPRISVRDIREIARRIRLDPGDHLFLPCGRLDDHVRFLDTWRKGLAAGCWELSRIVPAKSHPAFVFVRFDARKPIAPQLKQAGGWLRKDRASFLKGSAEVRPHLRHWPLYLRLLDAADARASYAEMTRILPRTAAKQQTARDMLQAAERRRRDWPY